MEPGPAELRISDQVVTALRHALGNRLVAVVLFGSQARGGASSASDWDILVIAEGLPERHFQRHIFLKRLLPPGCAEAASLLAKTPREFESCLPSLYLDIALDGQILYDQQSYAAHKLSKLRGMIEKKGLYRERTQAGDVWHWRKPPSGAWALEWGE